VRCSFRKTLGTLANDFCKTPEQFKAWSINLRHENIAPVGSESIKSLVGSDVH
jgi:hypothetical protein